MASCRDLEPSSNPNEYYYYYFYYESFIHDRDKEPMPRPCVTTMSHMANEATEYAAKMRDEASEAKTKYEAAKREYEALVGTMGSAG